MVPALIIAALVALLLCEATAHQHFAERRILAKHHDASSTFVFAFAFVPIGTATVSSRALLSRRKPSIDQIARGVFTSFKFCKLSKACHEAFARLQRIPEVEDIIRPHS